LCCCRRCCYILLGPLALVKKAKTKKKGKTKIEWGTRAWSNERVGRKRQTSWSTN
jgi:hypothetical protein